MRYAPYMFGTLSLFVRGSTMFLKLNMSRLTMTLKNILQCDILANFFFKAGFPMIADDCRRSRIANRRSQTIAKRVVSVWSQTIASDRRADCCIHFGQWKCQNLIHARIHSKQNGGRRGRNFAASKFIIPLVNRFWNSLGTSRYGSRR